MSGLGNTFAQIQGLRRKFERLLAAARKRVVRPREATAQRATRLRELTGFGANPGNLRMFAYVPDRLPELAPLIVALHGCSQTADEYDYGTGWSSLADRLGFAVVFPEQPTANNPKNCFSWFLPGDITRDRGEALSIRQMVKHAIAAFGNDRHKVFVTGLSAGGAMAAVMLATYPEVFAGGAIIAGLPYGCARSVQQAFEAMFRDQTTATHVLGDRVRAASRHRGPWPKISVWHGTADPIVAPCNAEDIIRQWTHVHGLSVSPSYEESIGGHSRRVWTDANDETLIEAFSISGMAHGVPLVSTGEDNCGALGAFFLDAGISSTHRIASFWRLNEARVEMAPAMMSESCQDRRVGRAVVVAAKTANAWGDDEEDSAAPSYERDAGGSFDPNLVIATAFKAAGLPIPDLPEAAAGTATQVAPGPIIKAALRAAGLVR
jgi:feruloyl esterase